MSSFRSLTLQSGVLTQIQNSNTLTVGAGVDTASGNLSLSAAGTDVQVAAGKNLSLASGSGNVDFSGSTGTFSTPTGALTFGGAATFTAAGTALTVNNNATITGTLTSTGGLYANGGVDRSTAATLSIGTTNASAIDIGKVGILTTIKGNLQVDGTETIVGTSTFQNDATFEGNATFGNAAADTVSFVGSVINDINFLKQANHVVKVAASTSTDTAGGNISVKGGDGYGNANGGSLTLDGGALAGTGTGGTVSLGTTNAGAITVGHSGITTTITGGLTQSTGAVSLTGNAASSLTTSSGTLTLTSAAAATWSTGAGALTLDGFSALNLANNGTTALSISGGSITVQAGTTLDTTSTGNINLPNNGSAIFQIEGTSVGATVTAANLTTLTDGSNADALHTHASTGSVAVSGLTTTGVGDGYVAYVSSNNTMTKAKADAMSTSRVFGANAGTVGTMNVVGTTTCWFEPSLTLAAGDLAYLSASTSGMLTNVAPSGSGQVVAKVGVVLDTSTYAGQQKARILFQIGEPVQLA